MIRTALARAGHHVGRPRRDRGAWHRDAARRPDRGQRARRGHRPAPADDPEHAVWLGSVKANVGHLEMASGDGRAREGRARALARRDLPPDPLRVAQPAHSDRRTPRSRSRPSSQPWPLGPKPRYLGISSFGFGGHQRAHDRRGEPRADRRRARRSSDPFHLLTLSAKTEKRPSRVAWRTAADRVARTRRARRADRGRRLHGQRGSHAPPQPRGRACGRHGAQMIGTGSRPSPRARARQGVVPGPRATHAPSVAFLFTGQGAQYAGMGRDALRDAADVPRRPSTGSST